MNARSATRSSSRVLTGTGARMCIWRSRGRRMTRSWISSESFLTGMSTVTRNILKRVSFSLTRRMPSWSF
nr:MAG TPA: hypothetical protein [Caudoviricetes sp.]